jgi:hypothetical protein
MEEGLGGGTIVRDDDAPIQHDLTSTETSTGRVNTLG